MRWSAAPTVYTDGADDVLHIGPVWDFDLSQGELALRFVKLLLDQQQHLQSEDSEYTVSGTPEDSGIQTAADRNLQSTGQEQIAKAQSSIEPMAADLNNTQSMNFARWNILGGSNPYAGAKSLKATYQENVDTVADWMTKRTALFESTFNITGVSYSVNESSTGWTTGVSNGTTAGTKDSDSIMGINAFLTGYDEGGIQYRVRSSNNLWPGWSADGTNAATQNGKAVEAVKMELTGAIKDTYDIYYRTYNPGLGWSGWAKNGAEAGSTGFYSSVQAVQIVVQANTEEAPSSFERCAHGGDIGKS